MSGHGAFTAIWPYAAAVAGVFGLALVALYRFGATGSRRGAAWKYTKEIDHARKLVDEGRYDEAAAFVQPLLRKRDITATFFDIAGVIADRRGKPAQAGKYWRRMQRYYPQEVAGYVRTARFLLRQGKAAQAHRVLNRARKIAARPEWLNSVMAEAAQAEKQWDEAIRLWAKQRAASPGDAGAYLQARVCLLAAGRDEEADALLADVVTRMPNNPQVKKVVEATQKVAAATLDTQATGARHD